MSRMMEVTGKRKVRTGFCVIIVIVVLLFLLVRCNENGYRELKDAGEWQMIQQDHEDQGDDLNEELAGLLGNSERIISCDEQLAKLFEQLGDRYLELAERQRKVVYVGDEVIENYEDYLKNEDYHEAMGQQLKQMAGTMRDEDGEQLFTELDELQSIMEERGERE